MNASRYHVYYLQQASQTGHGHVFIGPDLQRGYGLGGNFRNIFSFIRPLIKPAAKFVGKQIIKTGSDILSDVVSGRKIGEAAREHVNEAASEHMGGVGPKIVDATIEDIKKIRRNKKMRGEGLHALKRLSAIRNAHIKCKRLKRRPLDILD